MCIITGYQILQNISSVKFISWMCIDLIDRANIITCKTLKSQHTFQLGQFRCDMYKSSQPNQGALVVNQIHRFYA